jgi:hypothetical protein
MELSFDRLLGIAGIVLAVLGIVIGVGVAIAMDPKSKGEMMFSIGCFIFSGLVLCLTIGMWSFLASTPALKRLVVSTLLFSVVCVSTVEASRWVDSRYRRTGKNPEEAKIPSGEEAHGATSSLGSKSKIDGTADNSTAIVERPSKSARPAQPTIIQTQAPYGNLAKRSDALGAAILRLARQRSKEQPDPTKNQVEYKEWFRRNDGQFRAEFYDDVKKIHQEMTILHVDDPRLDELIKKHEDYFAARQKDVPGAIEWPQNYHLSIENIEEIGERFRSLSTQIPEATTEPRLSVQGQSLLAEINKLVEPYDKDMSNPAFRKMDGEVEGMQLHHNFMDNFYENALHFREQALGKLGRASGDLTITLIYQTEKNIDTTPSGPEPKRYLFTRSNIARICKDIQGLVDQLTAIGE